MYCIRLFYLSRMSLYALLMPIWFLLCIFGMPFQVFGKTPSGNRLSRIQQSPYYRNGSFQNLEHTPVMREGASYPKLMRNFFNKPDDVTPKQAVPSVCTDLKNLGDDLQIIWFGHSSYLVYFRGINILVDPVFSGHASPVKFFGKAFPGADVYSADDMPNIDMLILTHDHYDHLDYETILRLKEKTAHVYAALGVGAHLEFWGYKPDMITELDWNEGEKISDEISITAVPARHFSGRLFTRGKTLWTAFVLEIFGRKLFLGGDSGYGTHFKTIGEEFGPFDAALLECGQYGDDWPYIHMKPEETVQAAVDLGAKKFIPVHWGKFALAMHPWDEPVKRVIKEADEKGMPVLVPKIGKPIRF